MKQSRIPFYAYVDETGNTGHNIFDENQPDFYTAALITRGDFDGNFAADVKAIADKLGVEHLHGKQLGVHRIESVGNDLIRVLKMAKAEFFVSRVEKRYLLATKVFDTFFDSGENAAVGWQHYNIRPLRLMLTFKLATCIDLETAQNFWKIILEPNEKKSLAMIPGVCAALRKNLESLKDARARQVLDEALAFAEKNPDCVHVHVDRRNARKGHFPNMVAFSNLLTGLEEHSKRFKKPVAQITHDQQDEFKQNLEAMHEMYSNASPEELSWAGESYSLQRVVGSNFEVKADGESPGIQITDILLWLYHQLMKGVELPEKCTDLMNYAYLNGWHSDFSFDGVDASAGEQISEMMKKPWSEEQQENARQLSRKFEEARQRSMEQYQKDRVAPFMRGMKERHSEAGRILTENSGDKS
jgi:hypothetical protein